MEEKNKKQKKEELQSRRDFFKKVAKATLPVLGAIVLSYPKKRRHFSA